MFIGREKELAALNAQYNRNEFSMFILYGRRRIGKTELLREFMKGKKGVYYTGVETSDADNLAGLIDQILFTYGADDSGITLNGYEGAFRYLSKRAEKERVLLIIDEYPCMVKENAGLSSLLQRAIDTEWKQRNIMLVLCGSSISFMEENVLGSKSPLYGRRTGQLKLEAFPYTYTAKFCPDYTAEENAILYGVTGGVPKYLEIMRPELSLDENLVMNCFSTDGYLYEEPLNLLKQEVQKVSLYNSLISAIATGTHRLNEIAAKTSLSNSQCIQALQRLEELGIVRKIYPLTDEKNKKQVQYVIADLMFAFWYRFVKKGLSNIGMGYGKAYYQMMVKPQIHDYMGRPFEKMCQDFIFRQSMEGSIDIFLTRTGSWWGSNPVTKKPDNIDVVALSDQDHQALIGECKFRNEKLGTEIYEKLLQRQALIKGYSVRLYALFSLGGFTETLKKTKGPLLYTLDDMYEK